MSVYFSREKIKCIFENCEEFLSFHCMLLSHFSSSYYCSTNNYLQTSKQSQRETCSQEYYSFLSFLLFHHNCYYKQRQIFLTTDGAATFFLSPFSPFFSSIVFYNHQLNKMEQKVGTFSHLTITLSYFPFSLYLFLHT